MPKYLLLKHYRGGPEPHRSAPPLDRWARHDVEAHVTFQHHDSDPLENNGEHVDLQALTPASSWACRSNLPRRDVEKGAQDDRGSPSCR